MGSRRRKNRPRNEPAVQPARKRKWLPIVVAVVGVGIIAVVVKVFIELRDANYPGSTYNLTYDPQSDQLQGIYYQAALQQQFEVVFLRMN